MLIHIKTRRFRLSKVLIHIKTRRVRLRKCSSVFIRFQTLGSAELFSLRGGTTSREAFHYTAFTLPTYGSHGPAHGTRSRSQTPRESPGDSLDLIRPFPCTGTPREARASKRELLAMEPSAGGNAYAKKRAGADAVLLTKSCR